MDPLLDVCVREPIARRRAQVMARDMADLEQQRSLQYYNSSCRSRVSDDDRGHYNTTIATVGHACRMMTNQKQQRSYVSGY